MALPGLPKQVNMPKASANSVNGLRQSLGNASRATSFGVLAQRSNRASIFNSRVGINYAGTRAMLNGGGRVVVNNHVPMGRADNNPYAELMKYQMMMQMGTQVATGIADIVKAFKSDGAGSTPKASTPNTPNTPKTTNGSSTSSSSVISDMQNAKDSTVLSAALEKAKAEQKAIPERIETTNDELGALKSKTQELKQVENEAQLKYDDHINNVIPAQKKIVEGLTRQQTKLTSDVTKLESQLATAAPEQKASIQAQLDMAKTELEGVNKQLETEKEKLTKLENEDKKALEKDLQDAKDAVAKNEKDIKAKEQEIKDLEQTQKDLDKEIPKQEKRLEQMSKKDEDEAKSVKKELDNIATNLQKTGLKDDKKAELQKKQDELKAKYNEIKKRIAINGAKGEFMDGQQFKAVSFNGSTIYLIDGKEVSAEFYNSKRDLADKHEFQS